MLGAVIDDDRILKAVGLPGLRWGSAFLGREIDARG